MEDLDLTEDNSFNKFHRLQAEANFYEQDKAVFNLSNIDISKEINYLLNPLYSIDHFAGKEITNASFEQLRVLSSMIYELDLRGSWLENRHLANLCQFNFDNLRKLYISENNFDDDGLIYLSNFKKLTELQIVYNKITKKGVVHIFPIKTLEVLDIGCTYIGDKGIEIISKMKNIRKLDIRACNATDITFNSLLNMTKLEWVNISSNNFSKEKLNEFIIESSTKNIKTIK